MESKSGAPSFYNGKHFRTSSFAFHGAPVCFKNNLIVSKKNIVAMICYQIPSNHTTLHRKTKMMISTVLNPMTIWASVMKILWQTCLLFWFMFSPTISSVDSVPTRRLGKLSVLEYLKRTTLSNLEVWATHDNGQWRLLELQRALINLKQVLYGKHIRTTFKCQWTHGVTSFGYEGSEVSLSMIT